MYLEYLKIENFRSCRNTEITFHQNLTVLVGENNGGKSNIVDAIRILTQPLNERRSRYPEQDDLSRNSVSTEFSIASRFSGLSTELKGLLISAVPDIKKDQAFLGCSHQTKHENSIRGRTSYWGGKFPNTVIEHGASDNIRHVYLPPLRDAKRSLGSASSQHIAALLKYFIGEDEAAKQELLNSSQRVNDNPKILNDINENIGDALSVLTDGVRPQSSNLSFHSKEMVDIARELRFKMADSNMDLDDINKSGLGYANLLYMATVVIELTKAKEADLTIFLVEEPEAHLHPQLQMLVLDFLLEKAVGSSNLQVEPGHPEGRIQIIVTTHSPNLTAWVSPNHICVIRSSDIKCDEHTFQNTTSIPIAQLKLKPRSINKINRYLDVTRSALLFGTKTLLVEGIAELLIIPALAKKILLTDIEWRKFRGAVLVAIEGVDFKPYVEILLKPISDVSISDLLVVITDADPQVPGNRKADLESMANDFDAKDKLFVFENTNTLEHELFLAGNEKLLRNAFLALHPRSAQDWIDDIEGSDQADKADAFIRLIKNKNTRKGDLAQEISSRIARGAPFNPPAYLVNAIRALV